MSVKMKWDKRKVLHLIELFRENENLWNRFDPGYTDRIKRDVNLRAIARSFGPGVHNKEILRKIKNLRSHYLREQKRYEERVAQHGELAPPSKWFAFKHLHFLIERCHLSKRRRALKQSQASPNLSDAADIKIESEEHSHADTELEVTMAQAHAAPAPRPAPATGAAPLEPSDPPDPPEPPEPPEDPARDEAAIFAEYIAIKLRQLDPISKSTVQHHIHNIIFQAEMGSYARGSTSPADLAVSTTVGHDAEDPLSPASAYSSESDISVTDTKPTIMPHLDLGST